MSCYFRHMKEFISEAGITITPKNKKAVDQAIHHLVGVPYKHCMPDYDLQHAVARGPR